MTAAARPSRSRERIGADHARLWVRKINLRNPAAKAVLLAAANYMNEDGAAWPGVATLAQDTDLSEDTVINRLRWCESVGVIALFKAWVDENGNRNHDGNGRVTSSSIRFMFDTPREEIEEAAAGATRSRPLRGAALASHEAKGTGEQEEGGSPRHCREQTDETSPRQQREQNPASPGLATGQPPTPAARTEEYQPEDSPQAPQGGPCDAVVEGWEEFKTAYEADGIPIVKATKAKEVFAVLSETEKRRVTSAARGLIASRSKTKTSAGKPAAHLFVKDTEAWSSFEKLDQGGAAGAAARTMVPVDSREGRAWWVIWRLVGSLSPPSYSHHGQQCFGVPPLSPQVLALADAIDARGNAIGEWKQVNPGSNEAGAWRRLTGDVISRGFNPIYGVPAPFPPRADGSWPEFELKQSA